MITATNSSPHISTIPAGDLKPLEVEQWSRIQQSDSRFDSPFFRPEYTQIVASVCSDVEIAVLRRGDEIVGFFPFHRTAGNIGQPVGVTKTDFQGVIARPDIVISAEQLIRGCRLSAWHFNHLIANQKCFHGYHQLLAESPYLDLSKGYEEYRKQKREGGSSLISQTERKTRVLERELGSLRLETGSADPAVFNQLLEWKRAYYRRIKSVNHLSAAWQRGLLEAVWKYESKSFSGKLSVLYARDVPVAIDLSVWSDSVVHSWCSSYDRDLARYSPGTVLLLLLVKFASSQGIRRIDFGRGEEQYKQRFLTGSSVVAEGSVDFRPFAGPLRRARTYAREFVRASPLRSPMQTVIRSIRSLTAYR